MLEYAVLPSLVVSTYFVSTYTSSLINSYLLKKRNKIKNTDTIWDIGCGMSGVETFGIGISASSCYGIDPALWFQKKKGKYKLIKKEIKDVIEDTCVPRPDFIFSKDYSGIQRDIEDLLHLESSPSFFISPCNCGGCKNFYYKKDYPLSKKMLDENGIKTYYKISPKKAALASVYDIAYLSEEFGYGWEMWKRGSLGNNAFLFMTKNKSILQQ